MKIFAVLLLTIFSTVTYGQEKVSRKSDVSVQCDLVVKDLHTQITERFKVVSAKAPARDYGAETGSELPMIPKPIMSGKNFGVFQGSYDWFFSREKGKNRKEDIILKKLNLEVYLSGPLDPAWILKPMENIGEVEQAFRNAKKVPLSLQSKPYETDDVSISLVCVNNS
jgi:hypothetical protein